jgi:radical SAM superfamily enzyme YgiQ (UPF0313 family)
MAVMGLSSVLNAHGFETEVIIIEGEPNYADRIKREIKPDIIGYSAATVDIKMLTGVNHTLKKHYKFLSIFGGPHPTYFPELIEEDPDIDAICIGEGEQALVQLAQDLAAGLEIVNIPNLHVRHNGIIIKNEVGPLIEDLDSLPFMNKHLYDRYFHNPYLLENVPIRFLSSRGCPYKCTYCFNHKFYQLYGIKGNQVRKRSVRSLIEEIKGVKQDFHIPMVSFVDDIFCISKKWVREFAPIYRNEVGLPYSINTRPNTITEEIAALLSMSGCYYVTFSIETGDEFLRNKVLKRNISEEGIITAANLLHQHHIFFATGNMLGIPGETMATLWKTVEINQKCAPHYPWASLFQPFPKLELTEFAIYHGYFNGDFGAIGNDQFTDSPLLLQDKKLIVRFHKFFALLVRYPVLAPLVNLLIKLPLDNVYNWIFKKYKLRLNKPIITADRVEIEKQSDESIITVVYFFLKDLMKEKFDAIGHRKSKKKK